MAAALIAVTTALASTVAAEGVQDDWGRLAPQEVRAATLDGLAAAIARGDYPKTTSVLIVRHGRLAYEHYYGAGGPELLNDTRSATKSITALAVGAAIADGKIGSAEDPAFAYLSDLRPFANDTPLKEQVTLADLLTMSSALACNDNDNKSPGQEDRMHEQAVWSRWIVDLPTQTDWRRDDSGRGPFAYCTAGAMLLGQIVQRAVGEPADAYMERRLFRPLGITQRQWFRSPAGEPMTGGGLRLRSRDLAKLAWMVADHGRWAGRQIVPSAWIDAILTPRRKPDADHDYGYLFWRTDYVTSCGKTSGWYMAGNGGNAIVVLPELDAALVITRTRFNIGGMHVETTDLIRRYVLPSIACASIVKASR